ncbi:MAG: HEPN domain-containing protein [Planctomycetes bacterium]|nr:HEPN domain-containing protein [Planctomycetota bacterium]
MQPEVAAEVRDWLLRAAEDLREAEHDLVAAPPLIRGAVFHCQQAAEKTIKAFLAAHERPFRKTHDIDEIGSAAVAIDASLAAVVDLAIDLAPYAWRYRYPGTPVGPTEAEAQGALAVARDVWREVTARLPLHVRP